MVTINKVYRSDIKPLVEKAFFGDNDLFEKYHIVGGSLVDCVNSTMSIIKEVDEVYGLRYYMVTHDGVAIGYMTLGPDFLHSFGINIHYRKSDILKEWWSELLNIMSDFFCTLHSKNIRAIKFLKKRGMIVNSEYDNLVNLITCQ